MALTHISTTYSSQEGSGGSFTNASIAMPAGATSGRILILTIVSSKNTGWGTPTNGTWTSIRRQLTGFSSNQAAEAYWRVAGASESGTIDCSLDFSYWGCKVTVLDGQDSSPILGSASYGTAGTSFPSGNVTFSAGDMAVVDFLGATGNTGTLDAALTARSSELQSNTKHYVGTATPTGSTGYTCTAASSSEYGIILVGIKASGGAAAAGLVLPQRFPVGLIGR